MDTISVRTIVEIVGKPKEHVKESLSLHLKKIKNQYSVSKVTIEPPVKQENYFSTFAEIELTAKNPMDLLTFCFDYMPSSIEILAPNKIMINNKDMSDFLNDLQARQHTLNQGIIQIKEQNRFYIKNTAVLLRNFLITLLSLKSMTLMQLHPYLGVKTEDIKKVIDVLIKEGKVVKEGDLYKVKPK